MAGDRAPSNSAKRGRVTAAKPGRYTPPIPREVRHSSRWVPVTMGVLLALGVLIILLNYLQVLPGSASNWYLLVGLGLITAGFMTATQWH